MQLNYQSFWNGGVRDGLLELLERGAFRRAVEAQQARSDFADADTLRRAVASFDARRAAVAPQRASGTIAASTAGPPTLVATAEAAARGWLDSVDGFKTRALQQQEVFDLFYRLRVYVLRIRPTTARTITGARLVRSRAALEAMLEQCRAAGIRAILFDAPVNPRVSLYRRPEDRASYDAFKRHLATTYGVPVHDLSRIVPADAWGTWMGEPDPLHLGRRGHRLVAAAMREMLRAEGVVPD